MAFPRARIKRFWEKNDPVSTPHCPPPRPAIPAPPGARPPPPVRKPTQQKESQNPATNQQTSLLGARAPPPPTQRPEAQMNHQQPLTTRNSAHDLTSQAVTTSCSFKKKIEITVVVAKPMNEDTSLSLATADEREQSKKEISDLISSTADLTQKLEQSENEKKSLIQRVQELNTVILQLKKDKADLSSQLEENWKLKFEDLNRKIEPFREVMDKFLLVRDKCTSEQMESLTKEAVKNISNQIQVELQRQLTLTKKKEEKLESLENSRKTQTTVKPSSPLNEHRRQRVLAKPGDIRQEYEAEMKFCHQMEEKAKNEKQCSRAIIETGQGKNEQDGQKELELVEKKSIKKSRLRGPVVSIEKNPEVEKLLQSFLKNSCSGNNIETNDTVQVPDDETDTTLEKINESPDGVKIDSSTQLTENRSAEAACESSTTKEKVHKTGNDDSTLALKLQEMYVMMDKKKINVDRFKGSSNQYSLRTKRKC